MNMRKHTVPVALSASYRYEFVEEAESKLLPFPRWCIQDPVMDHGVVTEIKQSWTKIKTGDCQGYRKYCHLTAQGKPMGLVSMSTPDSQIHDHSVIKKEGPNLLTSRSERRMSHLDSALNDTALGDSNKTADLRTGEEKIGLESSGHSGHSEEKADPSKGLLEKKEGPKRFKVGSGSPKKESLGPRHKRVKSLPPSPSLMSTDSPSLNYTDSSPRRACGEEK
jgi:hypothetical protein